MSSAQPPSRARQLGLSLTWAGVLVSLMVALVQASGCGSTRHSVEASPDFGIGSAIGEHSVAAPIVAWLMFGVPTIIATIGTRRHSRAARAALISLLGLYALACGSSSAMAVPTRFLSTAPVVVDWRLDAFAIGVLSVCVLAAAAFVSFLVDSPE